MTLMSDSQFRRAVASLQARSERAADPERLVATFVDKGFFDLVDTPNNQILYGRRGTGKTHVLRVLESTVARRPNQMVVYIDARTLGSTELFTDPSRPTNARLLGLFKDIVAELHGSLFDHLVQSQRGDVEGALETLATIESALVYREADSATETSTNSSGRSDQAGASVTASLSAGGPALAATLGGQRTENMSDESASSAVTRPKIVIPSLHRPFEQLLNQLGLERLVVLIDEWSSVPFDLQPYLAEFLAKVFFANPNVTIKIASLEFRSKFSERDQEQRKIVGFELSSDIDTKDLDDYYVYDRDPSGLRACSAMSSCAICWRDSKTKIISLPLIRFGNQPG